MKNPLTLFALTLAGFGLSAPLAAQNCSDVSYRLWRPGGQEIWYAHGDTLEVTSGEEVHLYVHTKARGSNHYSTSADLGYPAEFGFGDKSKAVRRHIRMAAQNGEDKRSGRVRFWAEEPGTTRLGYRINGVKPPGDLGRIPGGCRVGAMQVTVRAQGTTGGGRPGTRPPGPGVGNARGAATELVEILYRGLLRRDRVGSDPESFVRDVLRDGQGGLERIAETMTVSDEFRYQALQRIEQERGGTRDLDRLRESLLDSIYRDLYGYLTPQRNDRDEDLRDLDVCLSNDRDSERACATLGRNLVGSSLFYEQHGDLIESAAPRRGRRR